MLRNEMNVLGDVALGIEPPLICELHAAGAVTFEDRKASFEVGAERYFSGSRELLGETEIRIARNLMSFSLWRDRQETIRDDDGDVVGFRFILSPDHDEEDEAGAQIVGWLSTLHATMFRSLTEDEGEVIALDIALRPGFLSSLIPDDYESEELPIWRLVVEPNRRQTDQAEGATP